MKPVRPLNPSLQHFECGVSLLEVLIAVVVLSIGLLGLAGLQLSSLRNNQSAAERSTAIMHVYSIAEAMRADRDAAQRGDFEIDIEADAPTGTSFAALQISAWRAGLEESLGTSATGSIACENTDVTATFSFTTCTVTIRWDDSLGLEGSSAQTLTTEVEI
jgi:type IV pilus assembly protein PilV